MKEIWINLELYFKSYEFSNFQGFFWIFSELNLIFKWLKWFNKKQKGIDFFRGSHVDATWHSGPRGSATRAHTYTYIYILYSLYNGKFNLPYIIRVFNP